MKLEWNAVMRVGKDRGGAVVQDRLVELRDRETQTQPLKHKRDIAGCRLVTPTPRGSLDRWADGKQPISTS